MLTHVHKESTLCGWQVGSKGEVKRLGSAAVGAAEAAPDAQAGASAAARQSLVAVMLQRTLRPRAPDTSAAMTTSPPKSGFEGGAIRVVVDAAMCPLPTLQTRSEGF